MKKWVDNNKMYLIGAPIGAILGWLYWKQVGCASGSCAITSNPLNSTLYGSLLGALFLGMFKRENKKQTDGTSD